HLSAAPDPTQADARLSRADADPWGPRRAEPSAREGAQAGGRHHSFEVAPMPGPTGRFGPADRLRRAAEFRTVGEEGRRAANPCFVVLVRQRETRSRSGRVRLGITVSRKVGHAVVRNRVKRRVREWFRSARGAMRPGIDLLVIARRGAAGRDARELDAALCELARTVGAGGGK